MERRARRSPFFDAADLARIDRAWDEADRTHGDAHIGNVIAAKRGAVWTDWEDAFVGPREYDIACLRSRLVLFGEEREAIDAMMTAYDADYDEPLANELGHVRNVQVILWLAVFAERHPDLVQRMRARLDRLP